MKQSELTQLSKPFAQRLIADAPSGHGTYVAHDVVTQKLLAVIGPFDFSVDELIYSEGIVDGCLATLRCTIDGTYVTITEVGDCDNPTQKKTNGDRAKNAASDAIKRCAMRLGVGLHLWSGSDFFLYDVLDKRDADAENKPEPLPLTFPERDYDPNGPAGDPL